MRLFKRTKRYWPPTLLAGCGFLVLAASISANKIYGHKEVARAIVNIRNGNQEAFLKERDIMNILTDHHNVELLYRPIASLDYTALERKLLGNPYIANAEVYCTPLGDLTIDISYRKPTVRVMATENQQYYLDSSCSRMPVSINYTARVPVVTADENAPSRTLADSCICALGNAIRNHSYAKSLVGQIHISSSGDYHIYPRLGHFNILLGDTSLLQDKLGRIEAIYTTSLSQNWDRYRTISVKYKNQVIGIK